MDFWQFYWQEWCPVPISTPDGLELIKIHRFGTKHPVTLEMNQVGAPLASKMGKTHNLC